MSIELINKAINLIDSSNFQRPYLDTKYGVTEAQIEDAQKLLNVRFCEDYRYFLSKFGSGDFQGLEFLGLVQGKNEVEMTPNTVWYTKGMRLEGLEDNYVVIENLGDGIVSCVKCYEDGNGSVFEFDIGNVKSNTQLAESFGEYFYQRIQERIENE